MSEREEVARRSRWVGAEGDFPLLLGEGSGEGAVPPPEKIFEFLK